MAQSTPFLDKLPPEMRLKIYDLLLVNDDLANIKTVWENDDGASAKYDLSPEILRTCRKVYDEAVEVLYSKNTFAIDCIGNSWDDLGPSFPSSLTRFTHANGSDKVRNDDTFGKEDGYKRIRTVPALPRILHWKVTAEDPVSLSGGHKRHSFISAFCKAICHTTLISLTICMICKDCAENYWVEESMRYGFGPPAGGLRRGYNTASYFEILEPLQMLRNIKILEFKCRKCEGKLQSLTEDEELYIRSVIKGDSAPDLFFENYERLLTYCKTFERWGFFRRKMGNRPSFTNAARFDPQRFNPYQYDRKHPHPVENHLLIAKQASHDDDRELFKSERKIILDYLEPQYQRISKLMDKFVETVKAEKVTGGIIGESLYGDFSQIHRVEFHLLLEDLAAAFNRDVTPRIRALFRAYKFITDQTYPTLDRERCLKAMNASLDVDDYLLQRPNRLNVPVRENRHHEWQYYVRTAGADMDLQWLEIRKARRGLFKFDRDGEARGCDIDVEEWRYDEAIVWDVMEPNWIGPLKEGSERLPFVENEAWAVGGWGAEDVKAEEAVQDEDYEAVEIVPSTNW